MALVNPLNPGLAHSLLTYPLTSPVTKAGPLAPLTVLSSGMAGRSEYGQGPNWSPWLQGVCGARIHPAGGSQTLAVGPVDEVGRVELVRVYIGAEGENAAIRVAEVGCDLGR